MVLYNNIQVLNIPEFQRTDLNVFFEEIIEMGDFCKSERPGNFRNVPGAVFQHNF